MDTGAQQPMEHRRNAWLKASVASARSRLDMIEGARFRFRDEATRLFALTPSCVRSKVTIRYWSVLRRCFRDRVR